MQFAGQAIAQQVVHSQFFQQAKSVGIYLHCTKLREVDTTPIVSAAVEAGKHLLLPEEGGGKGWGGGVWWVQGEIRIGKPCKSA